jgi:hypothetical protein
MHAARKATQRACGRFALGTTLEIQNDPLNTANLFHEGFIFEFMDTALLETKFAHIGARLKVADQPSRRSRASGLVSLDVQSDRNGEFFEVVPQPKSDVEVAVLDVQRDDRHLLLLVREAGEKHKYLCGHDERHWFVAAIPESAPVGTVRQAKEALKPEEVRTAQSSRRLSAKVCNRRKNAAFIRQGEWFFVPVVGMTVDKRLTLLDEPLSRGNGGKPHWAEFCYRTGGETVYVCSRYPSGVTAEEHQTILIRNPKAKQWGWRAMRRNAGVYVRGHIRHADHKTVMLHGWHQVVMNTEGQSKAMRNVAFLD